VYFDALPYWFVALTVTFLGLSFGSFLNVVIYRLPRGLSLVRPGSTCPGCGTAIAPYDNIPVLGWLFLGGKSRCCKTKISPRYPAVELLAGLLAWAILVLRIEPQRHELLASEAAVLFVLYFTIALMLLAAALIDVEHMILPDSLTWGGAILGLLSSPFRPDVAVESAFLGALIGYVGIWFPFIWLHEKLRGFPGMGLGDAKLGVLAGAWFGPWGFAFTLFAGAVQGTLFTVIVLLVKGKLEEPEAVRQQREELLLAIEQAEGKEKEELLAEYEADPLAKPPDEALGGARIAFGPFLALALIELVLFSDTLGRWARLFLLP
jgi:leader peptidase (prepilin peptidase)/N-methyltransferase